MKWIIVAAFAIGALTNAFWWATYRIDAQHFWLPDCAKDRSLDRMKFHKIGAGWDLTWTILAILLLP